MCDLQRQFGDIHFYMVFLSSSFFFIIFSTEEIGVVRTAYKGRVDASA